MARLRSIAAAVFVGLAAPAHAQVDRWSAEISEAATRFRIPEDWIRRVMQAESGGRTQVSGAPITSRAGAMGLMQLMPGTWDEMRAAYGLGSDPFDPHDNIVAGAAYLRTMYDRFGYPGLFAAYNAGPARYFNHLVTGSRLPSETMIYLRKTVESTGPARGSRVAARPVARRATALMLVLPAAGQAATGPGAPAALFAIRH